MSTFIAADSGPGSHLGPGVPGDAPFFRSLEFHLCSRLSTCGPALAVQDHSPCGETGAITRPSEPPNSLGRGQPNSWNNRPQAACHATLGLQSSPASTYPAARRGSNGAQRGWRIPDVDLAKSGLRRCLTPYGGGGYDLSGSVKGVENRFPAAQILVFAHTQGF
ncbi:hypothetical protein GALL_375660 [mine drainage metagenome]|uniref:Uncharacterized protein n=1 Tax=mine drainage metagenome TaxID=410659 RepID=A0A1J5QXR0_9ZZZZ